MNLLDLLLPDAGVLRYETYRISQESGDFYIHVSTKSDSSRCPLCHQPTDRVHSRYLRRLADLPMVGYRLQLILRARKFFCHNDHCRRIIFCERIPVVARAWGRRTERLRHVLQQIGLVVGGAPGARLSQQLALPAGIDLLLTLARQVKRSVKTPLRCIGVDDWAYRKGCRYGTIVVDLERGQVVDILPDRTVETLAKWLRQHPSIRIVSRDRATAYAQAVRDSLPSVQQVADRWHLLTNMTDALYRTLLRYQSSIHSCYQELYPQGNQQPGVASPYGSLPWFQVEERRKRRIARARKLSGQGLSQKAIARRLGCHPKTISRDLAGASSPITNRLPRPSLLDPFKSYLEKRVQAGCLNAAQLYREIAALGYQGGVTTVRTFIKPRQLRQLAASGQEVDAQKMTKAKAPTPRAVAHMITKAPPSLTDHDSLFLTRLGQQNNELATLIDLGRQFATLIRQQSPDRLNLWLLAAKRSGIPKMRSFAASLRQDYAAVRAALSLSYSNGPTEGHINRLKCVKRQMYGRAKFDLLRARLIAS